MIVKTEWDGLVPALTSGKIDAIIAGMSPTAERKETIDFSDNYYTSNLVMVVKKAALMKVLLLSKILKEQKLLLN